MSFPKYLQTNQKDCGPACLRIIGLHYGKQFSIQNLRQLSSTGRMGSTLEGIKHCAEEIGFKTAPVKLSLEQILCEAPLPLIAHWNSNHYVVVYKATKRRIYVSDPAQGLITYNHDQFRRGWVGKNLSVDQGGVALLLETVQNPEAKIEEEDVKETNIKTKAFLYSYIKPHFKLLTQILLSLFVGNVLQLFVPFLTQNIVDTGILKKDINFIWLVLGAQLALTVGQMGLDLLRGWTLLYISSRMNISLLSDFFVKLMRLPIRYFDTRLTGDLTQRIQDHRRIESFLTGTTLSVLFSTFTLLLYGFVLAYYSLTLFAVFITGSIFYILWILVFLKRREKLDYSRFQQASETQSKIYELINGMQTIKLYNAEKIKRWSWERIQVKLFHLNIKFLTLENVQSSGSRIINEVKNIFISIISAKLVIDGHITLGTMLAVSYIIGQLNSPVLQFVAVAKSWQDARISLDRIAEIHTKEEETSHDENSGNADNEFPPVSTLPPDHTLSLERVSFSYDLLSPAVLKDISLKIPAGKVTAIVGSSGGGKSTLLKLLMRFYEPTSGKIRIADKELKHTSLSEWRARCGVVLQDGFVFNDTIGGNIAVGEEIPSIDRLIYAARVANILPFIEDLPLGFDTKIGQEGLGISGGQRQRIQIARAIYQNPDILFLDEATSSLDANNERQIMENLERFYTGKTVIVAAHRLSTVQRADKIIVLEDGQIVEEGNHKSLSALKGRYYSLVKDQLNSQ